MTNHASRPGWQPEHRGDEPTYRDEPYPTLPLHLPVPLSPDPGPDPTLSFPVTAAYPLAAYPPSDPPLRGELMPAPVPPVPIVVVVPQKSAGAAVVLELVLGFFGIFGVGNLYAGRIATGFLLMISFWVLFWLNVVLVFLVVGLVTLPLTWLTYLVMAPLLAAGGVSSHNARVLAGLRP
ncbi:TM2 domain-containing protein [Plantactinospora sp. B5E13]|uniref:TM2 domain-containing protein n=1 Tax=unclassified Plantactinospora TaxID=2631981 RepID=UPI00325EF067